MQKDETFRRKWRSASSHGTQRTRQPEHAPQAALVSSTQSSSCHSFHLWVRRQLCPLLSVPQTDSNSPVTLPLILSHTDLQCWISPCILRLCFSLWEKWFLPKKHGPASPVCTESKRQVNQFTAEENLFPLHPFTQINCESSSQPLPRCWRTLLSFPCPLFLLLHAHECLKCWSCYQGHCSCCICL